MNRLEVTKEVLIRANECPEVLLYSQTWTRLPANANAYAPTGYFDSSLIRAGSSARGIINLQDNKDITSLLSLNEEYDAVPNIHPSLINISVSGPGDASLDVGFGQKISGYEVTAIVPSRVEDWLFDHMNGSDGTDTWSQLIRNAIHSFSVKSGFGSISREPIVKILKNSKFLSFPFISLDSGGYIKPRYITEQPIGFAIISRAFNYKVKI
jgi:hypothetical protein